MKILVTGSEGFIGKAVYNEILHANNNLVIGWDTGEIDANTWNKSFQNLAHRHKSFDLIVHAGSTSNSQADKKLCRDNIYFPSCVIATWVKEIGAKLLYFSSSYATNSDSEYGKAKKMTESLISKRLDKDVCIFRPFAVWSKDEHLVKRNNLSIISKYLTGQLPVIFRDCIRDFIHVSDVVSAVKNVLKNWQHGCFDIGTSIGTSIIDFPANNIEVIDTGNTKGYKPILVAEKEKMLSNWNPTPFNIKEFQNA